MILKGPESIIALFLGPRQFEIVTGSAMRGQDRQASINIQDALVPLLERGEPLSEIRGGDIQETIL